MILDVLTILVLIQCASMISRLIGRRRHDVLYYVSKSDRSLAASSHADQVLAKQPRLAGGDLVAFDGILCRVIGAHVLDKAARGGGRQFYRFAGHASKIG